MGHRSDFRVLNWVLEKPFWDLEGARCKNLFKFFPELTYKTLLAMVLYEIKRKEVENG
jgi:hypothetical protein